MRKMWLIFALAAILGLYVCYSTLFTGKQRTESIEKIINTVDLVEGDLIFWRPTNKEQRADHVAAVLSTTYEQNRIRIVHATNNKQFYGFKDTFLPSNKKMARQSKYFYVVRVQDPEARKRLISILHKWLE